MSEENPPPPVPRPTASAIDSVNQARTVPAKRKHVVKELILTQHKFLRDMRRLIDVYLSPLVRDSHARELSQFDTVIIIGKKNEFSLIFNTKCFIFSYRMEQLWNYYQLLN